MFFAEDSQPHYQYIGYVYNQKRNVVHFRKENHYVLKTHENKTYSKIS